MVRSRFGYRTPVPSTTSSRGTTKQISFKDGINTGSDNDDLKPTELEAAIDARMVRIGRYKTRKGADRYSLPVGEAINVQQTSVTGASAYTLNGTSAIAMKLTTTASGRATRADINLRSTATSSGVLLVELYSDASSVPGTLLARSSILPAAITSTFTYLPAYFNAAPLLATTTSYWLVIKGQSTTGGNYEISTTTTATTSLTSNTSGSAWSVTTYAGNAKLYTSTDGGVKGVFRAYRPNGQKVTFFAHGSSMYTVAEGTGVVTAIKTGLNSAATYYRFQMVQDKVYWINGLEKPYVYDFTTTTQITAAPYIPTHILEHKGVLTFVDATDRTRLFYTNFAAYDTFTSTDFIYVPAPKSYDSLTALAKLNGVEYMFANRNKFQLLGSDNATFSLDEAASQRGTFSQESVIWDNNYIYHADEDGIHQFNGTSDVNLASMDDKGGILPDYLEIADKSKIQLDIFNNRLYCFYPSPGAAENDSCFVFHLIWKRWESFDKYTYIGKSFGRHSQDNLFIQGSNKVGALYFGELETNDYHNLGDQLQYELRTPHSHYDSPAQLKRAPMWRPTFTSADSTYSVQVGYQLDQRDVDWNNVPLGGIGARFDSGETFDSGVRFAMPSNVTPTSLIISGEFKRLQRRYQHIAAREPVEFDSEVISIQTQRMR